MKSTPTSRATTALVGCDDGSELEAVAIQRYRLGFVTRDHSDIDFGGAEGADDLCQEAAEAVGLDGTYKAWLSDAVSAPADRFVTTPALP